MINIWKWFLNLFKSSKTEQNEVVESPKEHWPPQKRALLVGINKYKISGADLNGCVNDIWDMYDLIVNTYGFEPDNVRVIADERATKKEILNRIEWLIENSYAGDEVLYFHSGHGSQIRDRSGDELSDNLDECVSGATLITTDVGLVRADRLHKYVQNGGECKAKFGRSFYPILNSKQTSKNSVVRVCCNSGMILEFSKNHKVSIFDNGFLKEKYAKDLTTEDTLLVSSKIWDGKSECDSLWYLIGLFIGDGHFQSSRSIRFEVRKDIDNWKNVAKMAKEELGIKDIHENINCRGDYVLRIGDEKMAFVLRGLGFKPGCKKTGFMEDVPLPMNESCWKGLLRGLFDAEGCSSEKSISFGSTDYLLVKLVLIGLRWFGIQSSVGSKRPKKGKHNTTWNVCISGENVRKFDDLIGFGFSSKQKKRNASCGVGYKSGKTKLPDVIDFLEKWNLKFFDFYAALGIHNDSQGKEKRFHEDHIESIVNYLHGVESAARSIAGKKMISQKTRLSLGGSIQNIQKVTGANCYTVYDRMADKEDYSDFAEYSESLAFDAENLRLREWSLLKSYDLMEIDSIEISDGNFDFYDFTVQEVEHFEADGILVHNCLITHDHSWDNPFLDDEIGEIFSKLRDGVHLNMICDTCHSGTMSRSASLSSLNSPENKNNYKRDKYISPPFDIAARSIGRNIQIRNFGEKPGNEEDQNHILLSGCKENQTSKELYLDGKIRGALTYNFCRLLRINPNMSWAQIHEKVHKAVKSMQEPRLSGKYILKNRDVFGGVEKEND